jgi:hypothetical protein
MEMENELPSAPSFILFAFHASTLLASVYTGNAKRDEMRIQVTVCTSDMRHADWK